MSEVRVAPVQPNATAGSMPGHARRIVDAAPLSRAQGVVAMIAPEPAPSSDPPWHVERATRRVALDERYWLRTLVGVRIARRASGRERRQSVASKFRA